MYTEDSDHFSTCVERKRENTFIGGLDVSDGGYSVCPVFTDLVTLEKGKEAEKYLRSAVRQSGFVMKDLF